MIRITVKIVTVAVVSWFIAVTLGRAFTGRPPTFLSALVGAAVVAGIIVFMDAHIGW
ncbi:hypothetical protein [Chthonobacter rhizosphaerae]|uniref:hypothetical protein n=1 Tax=Chthonobacter rhizosphaerae TaxID=2735553 RepID=UPI0015EEE1E8|nr:hypothetical protein [Chthonobacter rhizosphaerae]